MRSLSYVTALLVVAVSAVACSGPGQLAATNPPRSASALAKRSTGGLTFTVYVAGQTPGFLSTAAAVDLAPDSSGNMWFTDGGTPAIGVISSSGTVTEYTSGLNPGAEPYSIVAGPDGNMWFSDYAGATIGEITPDGTITEYDASQYQNSKALGIAIGAHGRPRFIGFGSQPLIGYLTPKGTIGAHLLPLKMTPKGALAADAAGNLWFVAQGPKAHGELVEQAANSSHLRRAPLHMQAIFEPCCPNVAPKSIVIGPDGNPWFTTLYFGRPKSTAQFIGTYVNGRVKLIRIRSKGLTESAIASGLAAGAKNFWMTGGDPFAFKGALWHIDPGGNQQVYNLPYNPLALTVDASGSPWFTTAFPGVGSSIVEVTVAPSK